MLSSLPVIRSPGARILFLASTVVTIVILLWAHQLSRSGIAAGLTPIFGFLFAVGDYGGSNCALLILLAAALVPGRYSGRPLLRWFGRHPGVVAAASFLILSCGAW